MAQGKHSIGGLRQWMAKHREALIATSLMAVLFGVIGNGPSGPGGALADSSDPSGSVRVATVDKADCTASVHYYASQAEENHQFGPPAPSGLDRAVEEFQRRLCRDPMLLTAWAQQINRAGVTLDGAPGSESDRYTLAERIESNRDLRAAWYEKVANALFAGETRLRTETGSYHTLFAAGSNNDWHVHQDSRSSEPREVLVLRLKNDTELLAQLICGYQPRQPQEFSGIPGKPDQPSEKPTPTPETPPPPTTPPTTPPTPVKTDNGCVGDCGETQDQGHGDPDDKALPGENENPSPDYGCGGGAGQDSQCNGEGTEPAPPTAEPTTAPGANDPEEGGESGQQHNEDPGNPWCETDC